MSPRGPYSCSLLEHACDFNGNYLRKQPGFVTWLSIPVANGAGVTRQASEGEGTYATQVLPDERPKPARAEARGGNAVRQRAACVAPWCGAQRATIGIPGGGGDRGRGPAANDPPGRQRARPLVAVAAAALHRLGAGAAPGEPAGAA